MSTVIETRSLTRRYGSHVALQNITIDFEQGVIHGLLGRNGAGKTTLMSVIAAQEWPTTGEVRVFGQHPHENEQVLPKICFVREDQRYPDDAKAHHAFRAAAQAFPNWNWELCHRLCDDFSIPKKTTVKKMSRGQRSAVAVIIGIASRAECTFFDEPYMGLDAVARTIFYDRLLEDYAEHPRTIILSSHLIDEIAHLIENVVLIDQGQIILDESAENLRDCAVTLVGKDDAVKEVAGHREILKEESLGRTLRMTVMGALSDAEQQRTSELDIDVVPVSLQDLVVHLTMANNTGAAVNEITNEEAAR